MCGKIKGLLKVGLIKGDVNICIALEYKKDLVS